MTTAVRARAPLVALFTYAAADPGHVAVMDVAQAHLERQGVRATYLRVFGNRDILRTGQLAKEIVARRPDVVLSFMTNANLAMIAATQGGVCPVVGWSMDLTGACLQNLQTGAKGNVTGVSFPASVQHDQLTLLKALKPGVRRIGHLYNPGYAVAQPVLERMQKAAAGLALDVTPYLCEAAGEFPAVIARMAGEGIEALTVGPHELFNAHGKAISAAAMHLGLPAVGLESIAVEDGVAGFAPDFPAIWERGAEMAARILQGESAGAIPVDVSIAPQIILNLRSIRRLGLQASVGVIRSATRVIKE
ncbi:ABC transporter substrate binding protein [Frigidibacter sp.]|uniref:ABC transporter substrate binding protein n=1 Tax=Frigidibacter sp. TaxID=2586418 RepID=UPI00273774C8|nr:ABC transporter substrate binding protein [Frigidibacter sp.]MDP3339307.1 ABC transporter substrate binding protein [Frigidibacter sp.]